MSTSGKYFPINRAVQVIEYWGEFPIEFLVGQRDQIRKCSKGVVITNVSTGKETVLERGHYCAYVDGEYQTFGQEDFIEQFARYLPASKIVEK